MMTNNIFIKAFVASVAISEVDAMKKRRPRPRPRPRPKPCEKLPTIDGTVDPSVILDWRILLTPAAKGLGLGKCGGCVVKNLGAFNDAGAVIAAFGKCGSPSFPSGDLPTAANGALSFVPPQNPGACKDDTDSDGCQECIDNTLAWSIPASEDTAFVGPNAYGANTFDIDDPDDAYAFKTVAGGCSASADGCSDDDKAEAAKLCGAPQPSQDCAGLPTGDNGNVDGSVVLGWRILFTPDALPAAAQLGNCGGCVVSKLTAFNDVGNVVAAFVACGSPPIDGADIPTAQSQKAEGGEALTFAPPQNPAACEEDPDSQECTACIQNTLDWAIPFADGSASVGPNALGADGPFDVDASTGSAPAAGYFLSSVAGGCAQSADGCSQEEQEKAGELCGKQ